MQPSVYVIILFFNGKKWIDNCLNSVLATDYPDFTVLAIDNASEDGSADYIAEKFPQVKLLRNKKNYGFAEGNNIGMRYALKQGVKYLVLLNQDTKVEPDWLKELVLAAERDARIGILTPMQYDYEGKDLDSNFKKLLGGNSGEEGIIETSVIIGAAMLYRASVAQQAGLFDPLYFCYHEENDLCRRVRHLGYKVGIVKTSKIYHWHSLIQENGLTRKAHSLFIRNELIYILKDPQKGLTRGFLGYCKWKIRILAAEYGLFRGLMRFAILMFRQLPVFFYLPYIIIRKRKESAGKTVIIMFGQHNLSDLIGSDFMTRNGQVLKYLNREDSVSRIIYVDPYFHSLFTWPDSLLQMKKARSFPKIELVRTVNFKQSGPFKKFFLALLRKKLNKRLSPSPKNIIVWLYNPAEYEVFDIFPSGTVKVFDTVDNWLEFKLDRKRYPWYDPAEMESGYRHICKDDNVFIISNGRKMTEFYSDLRGSNNNILEVPNGVDLELFSLEKMRGSETPRDIRACRHPIIGYVGVLQERFDSELFRYLVENNPDYNFVIVGKIIKFRDFNFKLKADNLVYLGEKKYSQIPKYIFNFDVCIMPHKVDNMTNFMSPMKLCEYLALGKPVVTSPVEGIDGLKDYVYIASGKENFNSALKKAIAEKNDRALENKRIEAVKLSSWETGISGMLDKIEYASRPVGNHSKL